MKNSELIKMLLNKVVELEIRLSLLQATVEELTSIEEASPLMENLFKNLKDE
jgi:hypothetical protein